MADFIREERYIVVKIARQSEAQLEALHRHLKQQQISTVDCVVVEKDWQEHEPVWAMLEARMTAQETNDGTLRDDVARLIYEASCIAAMGKSAFEQHPWKDASPAIQKSALNYADAIIPLVRAAERERCAGVARRHLAAMSTNVALPALRDRYGDEACEHASETLAAMADDVPAAIMKDK